MEKQVKKEARARIVELNQPPREKLLIKKVHLHLKCSRAQINTSGLHLILSVGETFPAALLQQGERQNWGGGVKFAEEEEFYFYVSFGYQSN